MQMAHNLAASRENVYASYKAAEADNKVRFSEGDPRATSEYIYENQREDAAAIVREFYENSRRVISIVKKTKVGLDGLMIEIARLMTTHPDDSFVIYHSNVRILTGMANVKWQNDMCDKTPLCFKSNIYHHGKLSKAKLANIRNALIIIDEIDTGDKVLQTLHKILKAAGLLDINHMSTNNNRFVFASATMVKELYDLYRWGEFHQLYKMTVPANYIGHADFLARGIIREFYAMDTRENITRWLHEDILENYGADFRIHILRIDESGTALVRDECIARGIQFKTHNSLDELSADNLADIFTSAPRAHIVLCIKGFYRRANMIPNTWKLRIGATHERYTIKVDNNVQIQGLPGRMTGYWRDILDAGHKTGPYRTSIDAVLQYEQAYADPFGCATYSTSGFTKRNGRVKAQPTMVSPENIAGLVAGPSVATSAAGRYRISPIFDTKAELRAYLKANTRRGVAITKLLEGNMMQWHGGRRLVYEYVSPEQFRAMPSHIGGIGGHTGARGMPILYNGAIKWIGRYDPIVG